MPELREEELDQLFQQAVSLHPSEDELGLFHDGVADEATGARIKAHLRRCPDCQERFDTMQRVLATYHEIAVPPESIERLKSLIAAARPSPDRIAALATFVGLVLFAVDKQRQRQKIRLSLRGARAAEKLPQEGRTDDGALAWRIEENDFGDLTVYLSSPRLELENYRLLFRIGDLTRIAQLERVDVNQLGALFTIPREEREQLKDDDAPRVEKLVPPEPALSDGALLEEFDDGENQ